MIWSELVQKLRDSQITGLGAKGLDYAGALLISVSTGDLSGISVAARTSAAGGGGRYGLYYTALPEGTTTTNTAWLCGLQQNGENRSNLALINTGETDSSVDTFRIELFNKDTGAKVATVDSITLEANRKLTSPPNRRSLDYGPIGEQTGLFQPRKNTHCRFLLPRDTEFVLFQLATGETVALGHERAPFFGSFPAMGGETQMP